MKKIKTKKIAAFFAAFAVLLALFILPAAAYTPVQIGDDPYEVTQDLSGYFGRNYNGSYPGDELSIYTFCIDLSSVCQILNQRYSDDGDYNTAASILNFNYDFETPVDVVNVYVEIFGDNSGSDTVFSLFVSENAVIELTGTEIENYGSGSTETDYILIPFNVCDGLSIYDEGWAAPNPAYQIFNNLQITNSGNTTTAFNQGRTLGREEGFQSGYSAGVADGSTEEEVGGVVRLVKAVMEAPFYTIAHSFDFTLFGINWANFIFGVLSLIVAFFVIKVVARVVTRFIL